MSRLGGLATPFRLALRGIAYRRATALIVLLLAVVAATAAVVAPLYSRAAEESIARGALVRSDVFARAVHVDVSGNASNLAPPLAATSAQTRKGLSHPAFGTPVVSRRTSGIVTPTAGPQAGGRVEVPLQERSGLCAHLRMASGRCPSKAGEVALTTRTMALLGARIGDHLDLGLTELQDAQGHQGRSTTQVVGSFTPFDLDDGYWVGRQMFTYVGHSRPRGLSELPPITDTALLGAGTAAAVGLRAYGLDVPVDPTRLTLANAPAAAAQVSALAARIGPGGVIVTSQLPEVVAASQARSRVVRVAAPLAAAQLVLLAWVILAHVVSSATQERAPELGLAKLRGLSPGRTVRFGLAEVVVLLLVAAPIGTLLGWLLVRLAADRLLEPGIGLEATRWVVASVVLGVVGGVTSAAVAAHGVARGHVTELLRRVPGSGAGRRAGVVEGAVLALVVAGVVQLVVTRGQTPGPVAVAGPGMIALGGALLAARALRLLAGRRAARAVDRGRPAGLLGWAGVARRPGVARTTGVLTAAIALLLVGVQAWSVAGRERTVRAGAETGAAVVLDADAPSARTLLRAVRSADPSGGYAMAVAQLPGGDTFPSALAIDSTRADAVLAFGHGAPGDVAAVLHPHLPGSLVLRPGRVEVGLRARQLTSPSPLTAAVTIEQDGHWVDLPLGPLHLGAATYRASVPASCAAGCRLVGLTIAHPGTDIEAATAQLTVTSLAAGPPGAVERVDAGFGQAGAWRPGAPDAGGADVTLTLGRELGVAISAPGGVPARVVRGDSPEPLPGLVADHTSVSEGIVQAVGLDGGTVRVADSSGTAFVPGLGRTGAVVDLQLALRLTGDPGAEHLQVWLGRDDPAAERSLRAALLKQGVRLSDRTSAAAARGVLDGDGAVLALLLFLACGAVAVVVAAGAMLVAAFVGARQRAAEAAALRAVGVRRSVVRAGLVLENLAGVAVALVGGALAAALAAWVVLPVLPLFDVPSRFVVPSATPDPVSGVWTLLAVSLVLFALAAVVAVGQLRGGTVDRIREGNR